jgi:hypothetical protein
MVAAPRPDPRVTHTFDYHDGTGTLAARKHRLEFEDGTKTFRPQTLLKAKEVYESEGRYDREGSHYWGWALRDDLKGLLYRLPELRAAIK